MASTSASTIEREKEMDSLIVNLQKDANLVTKAVEKLADDHDSNSSLSYPNGISLLSLKTDVLLSYIHHLVLLVAHRVRGFSLATSPGKDLLSNLVRNRLVLEKVKPLQGRLRYQIEKLNKALQEEEKEKRRGAEVGAGEEDEGEEREEEQKELDPLSFRPNLSAFKPSTARSREAQAARASSSKRDDSDSEDDGIYKPPKLMSVSYDPDSKRRKDRSGSPNQKIRGRNAALLSDLSSGLSSNPFEVSSGGVGLVGNSSNGKGLSKRARELKDIEDYEEDNYTRLTMSKKDSKKRRRDEEDIALGGAGQTSSNGRNRVQGRIGAGMEEEFGDLLRGSERSGNGKGKKKRNDDAYDVIRKNHNVGLGGTLKRARVGAEKSTGGIESMGTQDKKGKTKFERQKKDLARGRK